MQKIGFRGHNLISILSKIQYSILSIYYIVYTNIQSMALAIDARHITSLFYQSQSHTTAVTFYLHI